MAGAQVCEGCKKVARRGGVEEAPKGCISPGRRTDFVLFHVPESVEGLQMSWNGNHILQRSFDVSVTGLRMPVANAVLLKHPLVGTAVNMSYFCLKYIYNLKISVVVPGFFLAV